MLGNTKIIALCTARLNDSSNHEFVVELNKRLVEHNCRLFIYHLCSDFYWLEEYMSADIAVFDLMDYNIIDSVMVMDEKIKNPEMTARIIKNAQKHNKPVITVDCDSNFPGCANVSFDFKTGFEEIVRHVIEGHNVKNTHFVAGYRNNYYSDQRIEVYKKVLAENGLSFSEDMVSYGDFWADPTRAIIRKLLDNGPAPEAFICANDIMAINVCAVLKEYNYRVPEDVIVTGFDGLDEIYFMEPQITSVVCDYAQMAEVTKNVLLNMMEKNEFQEKNLIVPRMLVAESCGCVCGRHTNQNNYLDRINNRFYRYQDDSKLLAYLSDRMQAIFDVEGLVDRLKDETLRDLTCVINKSCTDESISIESLENNMKFEDNMIVVHDYSKQDAVPYETRPLEVYKEIERLLDKKVPIIFNAVCSINRLLGFVYFYFDSMDITCYSRISQIISALSSGLSGFMSVQHQRYLNKKVLDMYQHDSLTGLYNRMGFNDVFETRMKLAKERKEALTVIFTDLDGLKFINDNYGHLMGDKAIKAVGISLKNACPEDSLVVRLGGDEMLAVVFDECDVLGIKKAFQDALEEYNKNSGLPCKISSSVGYYQTKSLDEMDLDLLVKKADTAMYEEKEEHHSNK